MTELVANVAAPADGLPEEPFSVSLMRLNNQDAGLSTEIITYIDALRAKAQELQEQLRNTRWNIREDGDALVVCKGLHDKHDDCEEVRYVPESALAAALEREKESADRLAELELWLGRRGYRRCDIPACNCPWYHGGHANERLAELADALGELTQGRTILDAVKLLMEREKALEQSILKLSEQWDEHPEIDGQLWDGPCQCKTCCSYATDDGDALSGGKA